MLSHAIGPLAGTISPARMLNTFLGGIPGFIKGTMVIAILSSTLHVLPAAGEVRKSLSETVINIRTQSIDATFVPDLSFLPDNSGSNSIPVSDMIRKGIGESLNVSHMDSFYATIVPGVSGLLRYVGLNATSPAPQPSSRVPRLNAVQFPVDLNSEYDVMTEVQMLAMINRERANAGLTLLVSDEILQSAARDHSSEMFRLGYFAHQSPTAGSPFDRMDAAGAKFDVAGENLAFAPNVEKAHRGLMNSPGHRENILQPEYRRVGIGVAKSASGVEMFTQNFSD